MADIGKRIRLKREELGMTQEELAKLIGYKNKSTIAKIENGTNDITQSKVVEFANILHTTVSFLMGWDTPSRECDVNFVLSDLEQEIIIEFRKADSISKAMVLRALDINENSIVKRDTQKMA